MRRTLLLTALVGGLTAAAVPAQADEYCVGPLVCEADLGYSETELQLALDDAFKHAGDDTVRVGDGVYSGSFVVRGASGNALVLEGSGTGDTMIGAPVNAMGLKVEGAGSRVSKLSVRRQSGTTGIHLLDGAVAADVGLTFVSGTIGGPAITLDGGAAVDGAAVISSPQGSGIWSRTGANSVVGAQITGGNSGVIVGGGGSLNLRRTRVAAADDAGVKLEDGTLKMSNTLIDARGTGHGLLQGRFGPVGGDTSAIFENVTMVGGGLHFEPDSTGETATFSMTSSLVWDAGAPVSCGDKAGGVTSFTSDYSDYDTSKEEGTCQGGRSVSNMVFVNPGFAGADDFHLLATSKLVDAGKPSAALGTDLDGKARVTDGNADGVAVRDIGAYERPDPLAPPVVDKPVVDGGGGGGVVTTQPKDPAPAATEPPAIPAPAPGVGTETPAPATTEAPAGPVTTGDPRGPAVTPGDAIAPAVSALALLRQGRTLRLTLTEIANVAVVVERRAGGGRWVGVGRKSMSGRAGANRLALRSRRLARGRYRVTVVATDAAGNRSRTVRKSFRIR